MDLDENAVKERLPLLTILIVVINVLAFAYTELKGSSMDVNDMISAGAMYEPAFVEGHEYYRIITHIFLHFGMEHLMNNMISLLVLGYALENAIGRGWFCFIYLFSGIIAGFTSLIYNVQYNRNIVSCGASGAIYGLMGVLLVLLVVNHRKNLRRELPRFMLYLAISLYVGIQDSGVDNAAHIGGFVGGFLICIIMCIFKGNLHIE